MGARPLEIGLREQHKLDKLRRIKAAATKLFSEKGFEAATTREIAKLAHVSQATIFQYAENKNELALLVFTDKIERVHKRSFAAIRAEMSLLEQLMTAVSGTYQEFVKNVRLTGAMLQTVPELLSGKQGKQAKRVQALRSEMILKLAEIIANAKRSGVIHTEEDPEFIARNLFWAVHATVRFWLAKENANRSEGLRIFVASSSCIYKRSSRLRKPLARLTIEKLRLDWSKLGVLKDGLKPAPFHD